MLSMRAWEAIPSVLNERAEASCEGIGGGATNNSTERFLRARDISPNFGSIVAKSRKFGWGRTTRTSPSTRPCSFTTKTPFGSTKELSRSKTLALQKLALSRTTQWPSIMAFKITESRHSKLPWRPSTWSNPPRRSMVSQPAVIENTSRVAPTSLAARDKMLLLPDAAGPMRTQNWFVDAHHRVLFKMVDWPARRRGILDATSPTAAIIGKPSPQIVLSRMRKLTNSTAPIVSPKTLL